MTTLLALTVSAALAAPASVPAPRTPLLVQAQQHAAIGVLRATPAASAAFQRNDSLKNGAIIGAAIGGIGFGGFVGFLCHALDETEGHGDCIKSALIAGGVGAAGGAAIGVGIDALFDRPMGVVRVRF